MNALLAALAVAFAAFCVWLAVRIVNRRERWAKWTLAAVGGLPTIYLASFGPACWLDRRQKLPFMVESVYVPLRQISNDGPEPLRSALKWYASVGSEEVDWIPVTRLTGGVPRIPLAVKVPSTPDEP